MPDHTPILMLGAGRLGGALLDGWTLTSAFAPTDILIRDPHPGEAARAAAAAGAALNPPETELKRARTVLLAVKPQMWREAAAAVAPLLSEDAAIVSVAAGVKAGDISEAFGRPAARVMPITAVAVAKGAGAVFSADVGARAAAHALFDPVAILVDVEDEDLMDAVTGVCGSAPAYLYAFTEALEAAGEAQGLPPAVAKALARATMAGAGALMAASGQEPAELRRQVTSPGGTTEAALKVLMGEAGLGPLLKEAVAAATDRSRELSRS